MSSYTELEEAREEVDQYYLKLGDNIEKLRQRVKELNEHLFDASDDKLEIILACIRMYYDIISNKLVERDICLNRYQKLTKDMFSIYCQTNVHVHHMNMKT